MPHDFDSITDEQRAQYQREYAALKPGDQLTIRFTAAGSRLAEVTRIARSGAPYVKTWIGSLKRWSPERRLDVRDLVVLPY